MPAAEHCRAALREALIRYGSAASESVFRTQRAAIARLLWGLLDRRKERVIRKAVQTRLRRAPVYEIEARASPAPGPAPAARCDRRMELRGAFLACGSLAAPARGYHLEFVPASGASGDRIVALLRGEGIVAKTLPRKGRNVVYLKDADVIARFLAVIGASAAVLRLEDVRALKETKNRIHRLVNTETANVDRAARAAAAQREQIAFVADVYGLRKLSAPLREVAELRLANPTETLMELGRRCNPPAKKSTVNGRLAAVLHIAGDLHAGRAPRRGGGPRKKGSASLLG